MTSILMHLWIKISTSFIYFWFYYFLLSISMVWCNRKFSDWTTCPYSLTLRWGLSEFSTKWAYSAFRGCTTDNATHAFPQDGSPVHFARCVTQHLNQHSQVWGLAKEDQECGPKNPWFEPFEFCHVKAQVISTCSKIQQWTWTFTENKLPLEK